MNVLRHPLLSSVVAIALAPALGRAQVPAGYPASYADTIAAARKEGKVVVYSTTDTASATPLINDFKALYPGISVEYNDMNSTEVYNRYISESAAGGAIADGPWSASMDLQINLVTYLNALRAASP